MHDGSEQTGREREGKNEIKRLECVNCLQSVWKKRESTRRAAERVVSWWKEIRGKEIRRNSTTKKKRKPKVGELEWFLVKVRPPQPSLPFNRKEAFDYFKETCWTRSEAENPQSHGRESKSWPEAFKQSRHVKWHITESVSPPEPHNVKVKVMIWLPWFTIECSSYLDVRKQVRSLVCHIWGVFFRLMTRMECPNPNKCQQISIKDDHSGLGREKRDAFKNVLSLETESVRHSRRHVDANIQTPTLQCMCNVF